MELPPKIQELVNCPKEMLTAAQIAPLVGKDANTLRYLARYDPKKLEYKSFADKDEHKVRFLKTSVLEFLGYRFNEIEA